MLHINVPFSSSETDVLMRCLSQLENNRLHSMSRSFSSSKDINHYLSSAKQKICMQVFDSFHHDEIIHMVYALDLLSRECSKNLTEHTSVKTAEELSKTLRNAASARSKLRRAITPN